MAHSLHLLDLGKMSVKLLELEEFVHSCTLRAIGFELCWLFMTLRCIGHTWSSLGRFEIRLLKCRSAAYELLALIMNNGHKEKLLALLSVYFHNS